MKQWELACLGDDLTVGVESLQGEAGEQPSIVLDPCPVLLWTTDVCLGFTSIGTPGVLSIDLPLDPSDGDLFDVFGADESGNGVIEAHLDAVRGRAETFRFRDGDREFRCLVSPMPDFAGRTIGTVCVGLESTDVREDEVRYVSRVAVA